MLDDQGKSRSSAFVRYRKRSAAVKAINALNGVYQWEGAPGPMVVKFADTKKKDSQAPSNSKTVQQIYYHYQTGEPMVIVNNLVMPLSVANGVVPSAAPAPPSAPATYGASSPAPYVNCSSYQDGG